ncbi:MAG: squalene--hopene cyclase, partial [Alistipes sp.]|nr:squalene--hopene cyclase [Alistipes sp.]
EVGAGVEWLMALQNNDGGMPTFCKGWGKLPFDRSSADISAHALLAMELWMDHLPEKIQRRAKRSIERMIGWMSREQAEDGSWTPLWFGDQGADDERSPVYGTATAVEYLSQSKNEAVGPLIERGAKFLTGAQNDDGGWGGARGVESKVTLTARALSALASVESADREVVERGFDYIYRAWQRGDMYRAEPIGLYFARLWYSEPMYNMTFVLMAMKKLKNLI